MSTHETASHPQEDESAPAPIQIWAAWCPFRKAGSPVLGNMGATVRNVIIIEQSEWSRILDAAPQLKTTPFNVGTFQ